MNKKTTILIVEDHEILRSGLVNMLGKEDDFEVIAEASDGHQALELATKYKPDIIVKTEMIKHVTKQF